MWQSEYRLASPLFSSATTPGRQPGNQIYDDDDDSYSIRHWTDVPPGQVCFVPLFGYRAAGQARVVTDENKREGGIQTVTYLFRVKYTTTA